MTYLKFIILCLCSVTLSACQIESTPDNSGSSPTATAGYATSFGRRVNFRQQGDLTIYEHWEIPQYVNPTPNDATLRFYLRRYLEASSDTQKYLVRASSNPMPLNYAGRQSAFLNQQMNTTSILSYLYYDNGSIVYNARTPDDRFGDIFTKNTVFHSNSLGKSLVSYVLGHAICEGYIDGIDTTLSDWGLMQNTLYSNQRIVDLLNMTARDSHVIDDAKGLIPTGRWYNSYPLASFAQNELLNTQPNRDSSYHYNGLVTNVLMNYTIYKAGSNYQDLLNSIFRDKAGIANNVYFRRNSSNSFADGSAWYMFNATPEDYMRIAIAIMKDWQDDTCVGQYLKQVSAAAVRKNMGELSPLLRFQSSRSYGGQFHLNYLGMSNRDILGMDGYGGQTILIDTTNSRIVVINTIHDNYDWDTLAYDVIRRGTLPD